MTELKNQRGWTSCTSYRITVTNLNPQTTNKQWKILRYPTVPCSWDTWQKDVGLMNAQLWLQAGEGRFMNITERLRLKGPLEVLSSNPSTQEGPHRAACPGLHQGGFWISPRIETPQSLGNLCLCLVPLSSTHHLSRWWFLQDLLFLSWQLQA